MATSGNDNRSTPYVRVDDVEAAAERWHALMRRVAPRNGTNLECGERSSTP